MLDKDKTEKMDEVMQHILDGALLYEFTNMEVASVLTSAMRNFLTNPHNKKRLEDMGIKEEMLTPNLVCSIQGVWTEEYINNILKDEQV